MLSNIMKANIHPEWYNATVNCACGNTFTVGAAVPEIRVEVCAQCHPFYTGQMKYVDTAGRVDAFKARQLKAQVKLTSKADKRKKKKELRIQKELDRPTTLAELRKSNKPKKN